MALTAVHHLALLSGETSTGMVCTGTGSCQTTWPLPPTKLIDPKFNVIVFQCHSGQSICLQCGWPKFTSWQIFSFKQLVGRHDSPWYTKEFSYIPKGFLFRYVLGSRSGCLHSEWGGWGGPLCRHHMTVQLKTVTLRVKSCANLWHFSQEQLDVLYLIPVIYCFNYISIVLNNSEILFLTFSTHWIVPKCLKMLHA